MADLSAASAAAAAAMNTSPPPRSAAIQSPAHAASQALRAAERRQTSDPAVAVLRALTDLKVRICGVWKKQRLWVTLFAGYGRSNAGATSGGLLSRGNMEWFQKHRYSSKQSSQGGHMLELVGIPLQETEKLQLASLRNGPM